MASPKPEATLEPAVLERSPAARRNGSTLFLAVVGVALGALAVMLALDVGLTGWELKLTEQGMASSIGSLAEVMAAVLGLSLTVVAIVVQLASARYPAKIVDLFMTDPINIVTFAFMSASCIYVVAVPVFIGPAAPMWASLGALALTVVNFGLLLPYFGHVFAFLEPNNIITQIQSRATQALEAMRDATPGRTGTWASASGRWPTRSSASPITPWPPSASPTATWPCTRCARSRRSCRATCP